MAISIKIKFISALEKCFLNEDIEAKAELKYISMLKNEHASVQLAFVQTDPNIFSRELATVRVESPLKDHIKIRRVQSVPVLMPVQNNVADENYLSKQPGLYPDLLNELSYNNSVILGINSLHSLWVDICPASELEAGAYPIVISLEDPASGEVVAKAELTVEIIGAELPKQELIYTQWFHADCLASYYNVPVFSERHWQLIENYIEAAANGGINMILTPVVTPPLDTAVGGERPTCQLVDITVKGDEYSFNYDKLNRWIDVLLKHNIEYIEICHLFTQWGAEHAPKIMATVDGEYKKIFGWETDAHGEEYGRFLNLFLKGLLEFLQAKGVDKMCRFHVSDEPSIDHLESYKKAKAQMESVLSGYIMMDALSNYEFYETGLVKNPIPANNHIEPFLEAGVSDLWTYYCCGQSADVSNRYVAMPSARNRIMGVQMYKYNITGFLQWGFNFYYNQYSERLINPYVDACGDYFVPAGDAFSVYPAPDGKPLDTIHFLVFKHAIEDMRALKLCEALYGREYVLELIEGELDEKITFKSYPKEAEYILNLREKVNLAIKSAC